MSRKVLFYNDSSVFGGHEVMALQYVKSLAVRGNDEVIFVCFEGNKTLIQDLQTMCLEKSFQIVTQGVTSRSFQGLRTLLSPGPIYKLLRLFRSLKPDLIVIVQGNIEVCTAGMVASKLGGFRTISYIPLAHSMRRFGAKLGFIRDLIYKFYYQLPDCFIAISGDQKQKIVAQGITSERITVIHNFLVYTPVCLPNKIEARNQLGIPQNVKVIGLIGRVDFHQKRQDFLVKSVAAQRHRIKQTRFLIVGSGPDELRLRELILYHGLEDVCQHIPWEFDMNSVYAALDAVVMPSAFEGVPLVMLESIQHGLPVFASNVDGMAEFLPPEWLFEPDDCHKMIDIIGSIKQAEIQDKVVSTQKKFTQLFNRNNSINSFEYVCNKLMRNYL